VGVPGGSLVFAQSPDVYQWELALGAGAGSVPVYFGSEEIDIRPFPYVDFLYKIPRFEVFVNNEDGAGVTLRGNTTPLFSLSFGVNLGESRNTNDENGEDLMLLRGTPEVKNDYQLFGLVELPLMSGNLFTKISFLPIENRYTDTKLLDGDYDGILAHAGWKGQMPINLQMSLDMEFGLTWMNDDYAEAFHSVLLSTPRLDKFEAESGIRDINASAALIYMANAHIGARIYGAASYLLGDAGDSPLTAEELQPRAGLVIFYSF
jgi:outer membrane scaffolding protein for murein synthesis (MipA/OmpV family)